MEWTDLSSVELRRRLVQRDVDEDAADDMVRRRDTDEGYGLITAVLG